MRGVWAHRGSLRPLSPSYESYPLADLGSRPGKYWGEGVIVGLYLDTGPVSPPMASQAPFLFSSAQPSSLLLPPSLSRALCLISY